MRERKVFFNMGLGYLRVKVSTAFDAIPIKNAKVRIYDADDLVKELKTDISGRTEIIALYAPDVEHTLKPGDKGPYYSIYTVVVMANGYRKLTVKGVQIFDTEKAILPVHMEPLADPLPDDRSIEISIPPDQLHAPRGHMPGKPHGGDPLHRRFEVVIPDFITVHLGAPSATASNVRIAFSDYIKNVASSEIYPSWPREALIANILAQISFALNRVFTEWYPSRGLPFHITNSTTYDQAFVHGRNIFGNISEIVDTIFNIFIRRRGHLEPFFAQFCNGTTVTCPGMSQWGTVDLAEQGMDAFEILLQYYPPDIELVETDLIEGITESFSGTPLREGDQSDDVRLMQLFLNRIRTNYPALPLISNPNGTFDTDTSNAVRAFQQIFEQPVDGVIGRGTWFKIVQIFVAVKKLADMNSEGVIIGAGKTPPTSVLRLGSQGADVGRLQFMLDFIALFYEEIPTVIRNSAFDTITEEAVMAFQRFFGLTADGVVGPGTWEMLYIIYNGILEFVVMPGGTENPAPEFPGDLLSEGSDGGDVMLMQRYLNFIFGERPDYTPLVEDGIFGPITREAVMKFQSEAGIGVDGIIGPITWNAIVDAYRSM